MFLKMHSENWWVSSQNPFHIDEDGLGLYVKVSVEYIFYGVVTINEFTVIVIINKPVTINYTEWPVFRNKTPPSKLKTIKTPTIVLSRRNLFTRWFRTKIRYYYLLLLYSSASLPDVRNEILWGPSGPEWHSHLAPRTILRIYYTIDPDYTLRPLKENLWSSQIAQHSYFPKRNLFFIF